MKLFTYLRGFPSHLECPNSNLVRAVNQQGPPPLQAEPAVGMAAQQPRVATSAEAVSMPVTECEEALQQFLTTTAKGHGLQCAVQELEDLQANGLLLEPHAEILEMVRACGERGMDISLLKRQVAKALGLPDAVIHTKLFTYLRGFPSHLECPHGGRVRVLNQQGPPPLQPAPPPGRDGSAENPAKGAKAALTTEAPSATSSEAGISWTAHEARLEEVQLAAVEAARAMGQQMQQMHDEALATAVMAERRRADQLIASARSDPRRMDTSEDEASAMVEAAVAATRQSLMAKYDATWHASMAGVNNEVAKLKDGHAAEKEALQEQLVAAQAAAEKEQQTQRQLTRVTQKALEELRKVRGEATAYKAKLEAALASNGSSAAAAASGGTAAAKAAAPTGGRSVA
eukprot:347222-Prymnesium_polylepis.1